MVTGASVFNTLRYIESYLCQIPIVKISNNKNRTLVNIREGFAGGRGDQEIPGPEHIGVRFKVFCNQGVIATGILFWLLDMGGSQFCRLEFFVSQIKCFDKTSAFLR